MRCPCSINRSRIWYFDFAFLWWNLSITTYYLWGRLILSYHTLILLLCKKFLPLLGEFLSCHFQYPFLINFLFILCNIKINADNLFRSFHFTSEVFDGNNYFAFRNVNILGFIRLLKIRNISESLIFDKDKEPGIILQAKFWLLLYNRYI